MSSSVFWRGAHFVFLTSLFPGLVTASYPLKVKDSATEIVPLVARDTETLTFAQPQAAITVSVPGTGISSTAFQTSTTVRAVTLPLAILALTLTVVTYWILIKYSAQLSNQVAMPIKFPRENMNRALQQLGNIIYSREVNDLEGGWINYPSYELRVRGRPSFLYARSVISRERWELLESAPGWRRLPRPARKLPQISCLPVERGGLDFLTAAYLDDRHQITVPAGSPAMKSIVQASIWEWVAVWLALIALVNTLIYNGFGTGDKTPDMALRLFIVSIYTGAVVAHALHVTYSSIYPILSCLVFEATWELLMKTFVISMRIPGPDRGREALTFEGVLMGETKLKGWSGHLYLINRLDSKIIALRPKLQPVAANLETRWRKGDTEPAESFFKDVQPVESVLEKKIKPVLESEVKLLEKAAEATLERTLANIAVLLGICLATGLSPWTSTRSADATSTQLGSYALLLSVSTGVLALTSSLSHFSTMADSASMLLKLKENILSSDRHDHLEADRVREWSLSEVPLFGFCSAARNSPGYLNGYKVTTRRLWGSMKVKQFCWSLLHGPVLPFLPVYQVGETERDILLQADGVKILWNSRGVQRLPDEFESAPHAGSNTMTI
ncbi:hypothetical protein F5Y01DRAFT_277433 [Xylaria sp. FL0043]|nr:hypothetical protein F5Y01DRAFT_277433 [Xylaria sp. FL0043]